jgi:hypothetical protein
MDEHQPRMPTEAKSAVMYICFFLDYEAQKLMEKGGQAGLPSDAE